MSYGHTEHIFCIMKQIAKSRVKTMLYPILDVTTLPAMSPTPVCYQLTPIVVLG